MLSLFFNRIIKPNKMKNEKTQIEFDQDLYNLGIYDAFISGNDANPFEITSSRNGITIGWIGNTAHTAHVSRLYLSKRPRRVWIHIIESTDGVLTPRLTEYQDYNPYKGNIIVKQFEVEV